MNHRSDWHASAVERLCDLISIIGTQRQRPVERDGANGNACMHSYSVLVSGGHACQVACDFNYAWHAPCLNGASHRGVLSVGKYGNMFTWELGQSIVYPSKWVNWLA